MKRVALICLSVLLIDCLLPGCVPEEAPPSEGGVTPPPADWSEVSIPAIGEEGKWALTPGMIANIGPPVFSPDGKTVYFLTDSTVEGLVGRGHSFLIKSDDGGHSWVNLSAFEELGLWEAFFLAMTNDELFIMSTDWGVYRSTDGGETWEQLPPIPDTGFINAEERIHSGRWYWCIDTTVDASGKPVVLVGTAHGLGGLWMLSYPYEHWVDMRIGNADANTKYNVWQVAFSPNYAQDKQIVALVNKEQHLPITSKYLRVTFKYGDEAWGERIADAQIPDAETNCDLDIAFSNFAFPDDYDAQNPVVYIGIGLYTEHLYQTPQYTDLYRVDGRPASSGPSVTTDLDVGGKGTSTPVLGLVVRGPADRATILAGGVGNIYRSTDGGKSWQGATKPPTGGMITWIGFDPGSSKSPVVYCISTESWHAFVPRGAEVPVGESAFCRSVDGGITWNELSMIGTTIDETISHAVSPNYAKDKTMFMLTRSSSTLTVSFNEDESVYITREPNSPGATAEAIIVPHLGNPPGERIRIGGQDYVAGTAPMVTLNDECPRVSLKVLPLLEQPGMLERFEQLKETNPWYAEQYLALWEQPRKAVIYVLNGSVTVTKGEQAEEEDDGGLISVDGDASDWQGIEPLATDPEGDAPSKDEDMKAFYATNDSKYLYFMVEFYGENPRSRCNFALDINLDGKEDYSFGSEFHEEEECWKTHVFTGGHPSTETFIGKDQAAFGMVLEGKIPLELIGNPEGFRINWIRILTGVGGEAYAPDEWEGSFEVKIEEFAAPAPTPSSLPIPFPSTESLWKTTDGGNTWERILTSNLKLWVDSEEIQVGPLESVTVSHNFAQDNTLFVYEDGDKPKVWVSTDGGATFTPQK